MPANTTKGFRPGKGKKIIPIIILAIILLGAGIWGWQNHGNLSEQTTMPSAQTENSNTSGNINNNGIVAQKGDWVYYVNMSDGGKLYRMHSDGSGRVKVNDDGTYINVAGDWVYYANRSDGDKLYKIRTDGSGRVKLTDDESWDINVAGTGFIIVMKLLRIASMGGNSIKYVAMAVRDS